MQQGNGRERLTLFRAEALLRYLERQETPVYPRLLSPRGFALFWMLLIAVVTAGLLILTIKTPVYARGFAVPLNLETDGERLLTLFVSAEHASALSPGKEVLLETGQENSFGRASIISVESSAIDLPEVIKRFGVSKQSASRIKYPAVIAVARFVLPHSSRADLPEEVYDARLEIGHQKAISHINPAGSQLGQISR